VTRPLAQDKVVEVFVSYNREDMVNVEQVVSRLHEEVGIRIWFDRQNLIPGEPWPKRLEQALEASEALVVFLGPNGIGNWQDREIHGANQKSVDDPQVRVIPVLLPGGPSPKELPLFLRLYDCVDFSGRDGLSIETEFHRLVSGIRNRSPNGVEEAVAEEKSRTALLNYYQIQENGCEHVIFGQDKADVKGSDLYVQLHLLTERIEQTPAEPAAGQDGKEQKPEPSRSGWRRFANKADRRKKKTNDEPQRVKERESWETIFRNDGLRLVFIGGAGSGKSFSLTQEIRKRLSSSRKQLEDSAPLTELELPILVKASVLAESEHKGVSDALLASVSDSTLSASPHFARWWRNAFESERGRRLFIVIDGLDELPDESEKNFRALMKELDTFESASIIISCRSMYLGSRRDWIGWAYQRTKVVEIAPLDEEQQRQMVENWFANDDGQREALLSLLETNYAVGLSCRTPLVLTLVCGIYTTTDDLSSGLSYSSLYKKVTKELLSGRWRDPSKRPAWTFNKSQVELDSALQDRLTLISRTVWKLFEASQSENRFTVKQWRHASSRSSITADTDVNLLDELERVGMLIDAGSSYADKYYSFAHRTLFEYFAAVGLVEQDPAWIKTLVKHMWCEKGWEEVIRFAASMTDKPGLLLDRLARETGPAATPQRPLEWLSGLCILSAQGSVALFLLIALIAGITIYNSREIQDQLKEPGAHLFQAFAKTSWNGLTSDPLQVIKVRANDVLSFYVTCLELKYQEVLNSSKENKQNIYVGLTRLHSLFILLLVMLPVTLLGVLLTWLAKAIFFRISLLKQDDIFRTGLRLQAEVVGLNSNTPNNGVKRVVTELLSSEKIESRNIYGAAEKGCIPESLLLLVGGNDLAREILIDKWLPRVNKRTKWLRRLNYVYGHVLSCYGWFLRKITPADTDVLLKSDDLKDVESFAEEVGYQPRKVALYIAGKLPPGTRNTLKERHVDRSTEQFRNSLIKDLNELLQGPSLFEPLQFRWVKLRAQTVEALTREPVGEELVRLNRLLLEDALPEVIRKSQTRWIRFLSWCGLPFVLAILRAVMSEVRNVSLDSDVYRALRGLSLITSERARNSIISLLEVLAVTNHYVRIARSRESTFTQLDIYAAKALAVLGDDAGLEKLVELVNRNSDVEGYAPLAVKELSLIDKRQGIQAAAKCLAEYSTGTSSHRVDAFAQVLGDSNFVEVLNELSKMKFEEDVLFDKILGAWLGYDISTRKRAREYIRRIANNDSNLDLKDAQAQVESFSKSSPDAGEDFLTKIKTLLEEGELGEARVCLDEAISHYCSKYKSSDLLEALDTLVAACDEILLYQWFKDSRRLKTHCAALALLGPGPGRRAIEEALIKWAMSLDFDRLDYDGSEKATVVSVLGEFGTERAGLMLLAIVKREQSLRQRLRYKFIADYHKDTFWLSLIIALGKIGGEQACQAIKRQAKRKRDWIFYHVAARSLVGQDSSEALRLLLIGHAIRGSEKWSHDYGVEAQLNDFAWRSGARISKVNQNGIWYVAISRSKNFRFRIRCKI